MSTLLKSIKTTKTSLYVSVDSGGTNEKTTQVINTKELTSTFQSERVPKKRHTACFVSAKSSEITHINTKFDALFIGVNFFIQITPELITWMQQRADRAITAKRPWNLIEPAADLIIECIAESGIEPLDSISADYVPPKPPVDVGTIRAMTEASEFFGPPRIHKGEQA